MNKKVIIIMVEDDPGHARLIEKNLRRASIANEILHFGDGSGVVDYFFGPGAEDHERDRILILLDLNLPHVDGFEVLRRLKGNAKTQRIPVIILTTTDNPREVERCYELGCNVYITKPVEYENFSEAIRKLGMMLEVVKVPEKQ